MNTFSTPGPVSVVLDIPAGQVRLIASERTDTSVEVHPSQASKKRDVRAAEQISVGFHDGVLRITAAEPKRLLGSSGSVDVTIALPAGSRIEGRAAAAELYGTGRLGDVVFEGGYRAVELAEAASAQLQVHAGEVTVGRLTGPAQIRNGKGDVTITEAAAGLVELHTGTGNLSVGAAPGVSATLDASTTHGRISNGLRNTSGAGPALSITATTLRGDIAASSR